jgi:O-antigen/teichoic acid export membrane protein
MFKKLKMIDTFTKNSIIVFAGISLVNLFNFLFQPIVAHRLLVSEFSAFRALVSIFTVISAPLVAFQIAVTKYSAEFNAQQQIAKIDFFLSSLFKKMIIIASVTFLFLCLISKNILYLFKIPNLSSIYLLSGLLALSLLIPLFGGAVQGLELFIWFVAASVIPTTLKLILVFLFLSYGFNISGAIAALLISSLVGLFILYLPLRKHITLKRLEENIDYKEIIVFILPVAISYFCFFGLVNIDMILVRRFFSVEYSGFYSLAQLIGNIFLFLPQTINITMLPRTSGLNAKKMDTVPTLKKSLIFALILCFLATLIYNLFPAFFLNILTGKVYPESIFLGRLFGISMSFFALLFILITYFLSIKDLRFLKYLILFTILEYLAINFFHRSLTQVQIILCINSILLFLIYILLLYKKFLFPKKYKT